MRSYSANLKGRAMNKSAEAFRTIGEVAEELEIPKHVLRFWEGRFP
ncbi:MAG TPA: transposase, partial [Hyphomicrobium sp.]|nr:transposase [Hyphomicrobium sp.]